MHLDSTLEVRVFLDTGARGHTLYFMGLAVYFGLCSLGGLRCLQKKQGCRG